MKPRRGADAKIAVEWSGALAAHATEREHDANQ
jgi:hypothetical protein